jgi:phenylalanyl-tRNA synthetase beta chain
MKISINWLKDYIALELPPAEVIAKLNGIGMLVDEWEETGDDVVLELETYANRPDTLGHLGVARELAAALEIPLCKPDEPIDEAAEDIGDVFDIQILDEDLCPRYCGMLVTGLQVGPSPSWLERRIRTMGLNPVNNVVDVSNYVLFATGQPIHTFDRDKLSGQKIVVRRAKRGEHLRTLEGQNLSLTPDMLVIADEKDPVALAGIIGGEESAVTESTRDVLIESANFDPVSVRQTWKTAGIPTDASYRFERGTDIGFPPRAARLAASLLSRMGGRVLKGMLDVYPKERRAKTVVLRHHRINELLGIEVQPDFVVKTLVNLEFRVKEHQPGTWRVTVPLFRVDIEREADLIEEIARFFGYENIPSTLPAMPAVDMNLNTTRAREAGLKQLLFHRGFDEVVNYSFSNTDQEDLFQKGRRPVTIRNPISARAALLRTTLLGGLLQNIAWNKNRDAQGVHIFEFGHVFSSTDGGSREQQALGIVSWGELGLIHWQGRRDEADFFHLKGACQDLMTHLGHDAVEFLKQEHEFFEPGYSLRIQVKGAEVGVLGLLRRDIRAAQNLDKEFVWAAEIDLDGLYALQAPAFHFAPVAKYPSMTRDISFLVDRGIPYEEVRQAVVNLKLPQLESFVLCDRYSGPNIPKSKVSLSIRFTFRSLQKTLLAQEVDEFQQKIVEALRGGFDLQLREGGEN